jgi:cyclophilin family peptidyl-prolyl cis-trans isomerase
MRKLTLIFSLCFILLHKILFAQSSTDNPSNNSNPSWEIHPKKDYLVSIQTNFGEIVVYLYNQTPIHKANFLNLSKNGFFEGITFHRVLEGFVIQGGDPNTKNGADSTKIGRGSFGEDLKAEFVENLKHDRGALAAARKDDALNPEKRSSSSQFYIVQAKDGAHHLDGNYTVFGKVLKGMEVVDEIASQEVGKHGKPTTPIRMKVTAILMKKKNIKKQFGEIFLN